MATRLLTDMFIERFALWAPDGSMDIDMRVLTHRSIDEIQSHVPSPHTVASEVPRSDTQPPGL